MTTAFDILSAIMERANEEAVFDTLDEPLEAGTDRDTWHLLSDGSDGIPPCYVTVQLQTPPVSVPVTPAKRRRWARWWRS